jgi:hypothetical protein
MMFLFIIEGQALPSRNKGKKAQSDCWNLVWKMALAFDF